MDLLEPKTLYDYLKKDPIESFYTAYEASSREDSESNYFGVFAYGINQIMPNVNIFINDPDFSSRKSKLVIYDKLIPFIFKRVDEDIVEDIYTRKIFKLGNPNLRNAELYDISEVNSKLCTEIPLLGIDPDCLFAVEKGKPFFKVDENFKKLYGRMMLTEGQDIQSFIDRLEAETHYNFANKLIKETVNHSEDISYVDDLISDFSKDIEKKGHGQR